MARVMYKNHPYKCLVSRVKRFPMLGWNRYKQQRMEQKKKQIVFIVPHFSPRVMKMAWALAESDYEIILLCEKQTDSLFFAMIKENVSQIHYYSSKEEALFWCLRYRPLVYHIFCCYGYIIAEYLIRKKIGKVVFDNYDGYAGFLWEWDKTVRNREKAEMERYCLENADGLCCRSFESQYQKRNMGYTFRGKRILFLDYCWNNLKNDEGYEQDNLSIFYGGNVIDETIYSDSSLGCNCELAHILDKQKTTYSLYCNGYNPTLHKKLIELDSKLSYFHFCKPVMFDEMQKKAMEHDYGILMYREIYKTNLKCNQKDGYYYSVKYKYASTNKFFDYVDAGLPIIGSAPVLNFKIMSRYGMTYHSTLETIEESIPKLKAILPELKRNIKKNIHTLSIMENIPRLIQFYYDIQ